MMVRYLKDIDNISKINYNLCILEERITSVQGCKFVNEVVEHCPYVMSEDYLNHVIEKVIIYILFIDIINYLNLNIHSLI